MLLLLTSREHSEVVEQLMQSRISGQSGTAALESKMIHCVCASVGVS